MVVGSGHLGALRLKNVRDIDIVVVPEIFNTCKKSGLWEVLNFTYKDKLGHTYLKRNKVELYLDVNKGMFNPTFIELRKRAVLIKGIPFASLEDILKFKTEYSKQNPKHFKDIEIIEKYLANK